MKKVAIKDAVGLPICHDMTRVIPGSFKGVAFEKGHIITPKDIDALKAMGKETVYVGEIPEGFVHENECADRIAKAIADSEQFEFSEVHEGKINIMSKLSGVLKIDAKKLYELNSIEHISISTVFDNIVVNKGQKIASERIIPLYTSENNIKRVEEICASGKMMEIRPFISRRIHLIITGNEVYNGLIKDGFYDVLSTKIQGYGCEIIKVKKLPDNKEWIKNEIEKSICDGAEMIICTGGMSVDEDDLTPVAIKEECDKMVVHGVPVQPGNMFLLALKGSVPIIGLPAAVMFYQNTIFDIVFPLLASGEIPEKKFFTRLSLGGLCYFCSSCHYPNCTFGKGR